MGIEICTGRTGNDAHNDVCYSNDGWASCPACDAIEQRNDAEEKASGLEDERNELSERCADLRDQIDELTEKLAELRE